MCYFGAIFLETDAISWSSASFKSFLKFSSASRSTAAKESLVIISDFYRKLQKGTSIALICELIIILAVTANSVPTESFR